MEWVAGLGEAKMLVAGFARRTPSPNTAPAAVPANCAGTDATPCAEELLWREVGLEHAITCF